MANRNDEKKHVIILDDKKKKADRENDPLFEDEEVRPGRESGRYSEYDGTEDDRDEDDGSPEYVVYIRRRRKKSRKRKQIGALIFSAMILVMVLIGALLGRFNNYREPVRIYEKYLNRASYSGEDLSYAYGNGLAQRKLKKVRTLLHENSDYMDALKGTVRAREEEHAAECLKYGDDHRYTVTIDRQETLGERELLSYTSDFEGIMKDIGSSVMMHSMSGDMTFAVTELTESMKDARVTRGYRLYCTRTLYSGEGNGRVIETSPVEFTVVKLKGRWIMWDCIFDIFRLYY